MLVVSVLPLFPVTVVPSAMYEEVGARPQRNRRNPDQDRQVRASTDRERPNASSDQWRVACPYRRCLLKPEFKAAVEERGAERTVWLL